MPDSDVLIGDRDAARSVARRRRGGRHTTGWGQVLQDWYVGIFITATLLVMLFAATGGAILTPDCASSVCLDARGHRFAAAGMALVGVLALVLGLRAVGPVSCDPARATWLLSTPADRGLLLRWTVLRTGGVALVAAGSWGVLVGFALAGGASRAGTAAATVATAAALGASCAVLLVPVLLRLQGGHWTPLRAARAVPDTGLARAGQVVGAVSASTLMLDTSAVEVLATRRRLARRGRFVSRSGRGGPLAGILVHELRALRRRARRVVLALSTCLAALVAGALLGRLAGMLLAALTVFVVARVGGGGLAAWVSAPGMRRAVPTPSGAITAVLCLPPFLLALGGAWVATLALGLPWWGPVLLALTATAGALRASDPPPGLGVALATPAGAVHTGLVLRLVLGPDLALGGALLVLIAEGLDLGPTALAASALVLGWQVLRPRD